MPLRGMGRVTDEHKLRVDGTHSFPHEALQLAGGIRVL